MSKGFSCPNPACDCILSLKAVQGAEAVKCPKCGMVFRLKASAPAKPKRKPAPVAKPAARPPTAKPAKKAAPVAKPAQPPAPPTQAPSVPVAPPVASAQDATPVAPPVAPPIDAGPDSSWNLEGQQEMAVAPRTHVPRRAPTWLKILYSVLGLVLLGGLGFGGYLVLKALKEDRPEPIADGEQDPLGYNFELDFQNIPWKKNRTMRVALDVPIALERGNASSFFALDYRKFERNTPGDPVLIDRIIRKMRRKYFSNLAWQPRPPSTLSDLSPQDTLSGKPALVLQFESNMPKPSDPQVETEGAGEVYILNYKGIVYWFIIWAPQLRLGEPVPGWDEIRGTFKLLDSREKWAPKPRPTTILRGSSFSLKSPNEIWESKDNPEDYDEDAKVVLVGFDPADKEPGAISARKKGEVRVLEVDKQPDLSTAAEFAKSRLKEKIEAELMAVVQITVDTDRKGKEKTGEVKIGKVKAQLTHYHVQIVGGTFNRYFVIGVINQEDKTLILRCDCAWDRRDYWEQEFLYLLTTFREL